MVFFRSENLVRLKTMRIIALSLRTRGKTYKIFINLLKLKDLFKCFKCSFQGIGKSQAFGEEKLLPCRGRFCRLHVTNHHRLKLAIENTQPSLSENADLFLQWLFCYFQWDSFKQLNWVSADKSPKLLACKSHLS